MKSGGILNYLQCIPFCSFQKFSFSGRELKEKPTAHLFPSEHRNSCFAKWLLGNLVVFEYCYLIKGMPVSLILMGSSIFDLIGSRS